MGLLAVVIFFFVFWVVFGLRREKPRETFSGIWDIDPARRAENLARAIAAWREDRL